MNPVVIQHLGDKNRATDGVRTGMTPVVEVWDWCITGHNIDGAVGIALGIDGTRHVNEGTQRAMVEAGVALRRAAI